LNDSGIPAQGVTAYDQPLHPLSRDALAVLDGQTQVIVPLFSPRTAAHFAKECPQSADVLCIAMSPAVAAAVKTALIAPEPTASSMLESILAQF